MEYNIMIEDPDEARSLGAYIHTDADRIITAIKLISRARFASKREPTSHEDHLIAPYEISHTRHGNANSYPIRVYQRAGIRSLLVAEAVRVGVLGVTLEKDYND